MKVQVHVTSSPKNTTKYEFTLDASVTAFDLKQRVRTIDPSPFPSHLILGGKEVDEEQVLAKSGLRDGGSIELRVDASEATLCSQLAALLSEKNSLPINEIGLLYAHKYGATATQALNVLGLGEQLKDFIGRQKQFDVNSGMVSSKTAHPGGQHMISVRISVHSQLTGTSISTVELQTSARETIASIKDRVAAAEMLPFPFDEASFRGKMLDDEQTLATIGAGVGSVLELRMQASEDILVEQLAELLQSGPASINKLSLLYSARYGVTTSSALRFLGWGEKFPDFLRRQQGSFDVNGSFVQLRDGSVESPQALQSSANKSCLELHANIHDEAFCKKAAETFESVMVAVTNLIFLNIHSVVRAGSLAKGTLIAGSTADAEAVIFVKNLCPLSQSSWLPGVLESVVARLVDEGSSISAMEDIRRDDDRIVISAMDGRCVITLRFCAAFDSYSDNLRALATQTTQLRANCAVSLSEARVAFIQKQPAAVLSVIRMIKWWREQQQWSEPSKKPTDEILELVTVYSALQSKPNCLSAAVTNVLSLLARFDELCIEWPANLRSYHSKDVLATTALQQRPLIMDPVDPYTNLANPQIFDSSELTHLAAIGHTFA